MDFVEVPVPAIQQLAPASYLRQIAYVQSNAYLPLKAGVDHASDSCTVEESFFSIKDFDFRERLASINALLKKNDIPLRSVFISYAWEDQETEEGKKADVDLKAFLKRLSQDLSTIAKDLKSDLRNRPAVVLDLEDNTGTMKA